MTTPTVPDTTAPTSETAPTAAAFPSRRAVLTGGAASAVAMSVSGCLGDNDSTAASATPIAPPVALPSASFAQSRRILSDPMLQNPGPNTVRVVWFTEGEGGTHYVRVGALYDRRIDATSMRMSNMLEDSVSRPFETATASLTAPVPRAIFRHEAVVTGLTGGVRLPYVAISEFADGAFRSGGFSLQPLPIAGQNVRMLLTSDQQNFPNCAAHYQKVQETIGEVDAVLFPGDFVSQPNRASEWFDRAQTTNPSFFQSLQGTNQRWNPTATYRGGQVLQFAPLFGCLGNHEAPGRWRLRPETNNPGNTGPRNINDMDNDPQPRWYAEARYEELRAQINPTNDPAFRERWIEDNSFEWTTYREMWSQPEGPRGRMYWAQRFGDVMLISLHANRPWRTWNANQRGKFTEAVPAGATQVTQNTDDWGFGDFTFEPFARGSQQYQWLEGVLQSEASRTARFRIVMSHQTMAGLGDNAVPVLAEQLVTVELMNGSLIGPFPAAQWPQRWPQVREATRANQVRYVRYEYRLADDTWRNDIEPLLLRGNVNLVHTGHSHLWNRTRTGSLNYLETSNNGNSFGAMFFPTAVTGANPTQGPRPNQPGNTAWRTATITGGPRTALEWNPADYPTTLDAHGREPIMPTIMNPMRELQNSPVNVPFVASNALTAFSVFESRNGVVSSYVFDTRNPASPTMKFDEFAIVS